MTIGRNMISDLEAIAAMPGLEEISEAMAPYCTGNDATSMLIFVAGQWTCGSRNELTSLFTSTATWELLRKSAARVGRHLPERPPTQDQLRHFRDRADRAHDASDPIGREVAMAMTSAMQSLVRSVGLLTPSTPDDLARPARGNILYGDGTVFAPLSDVTVNKSTGEVTGSRSAGGHRPRVAERFHGKSGTDERGSAGLPIALVGVHGDQKWQRCVTGVDMYFDRRETAASMGLFERSLAAYGTGIHAFIYDKLLSGKDVREVMHAGVLPLVEMPNAKQNEPHIIVPDHLRHTLGSKSQPKDRLTCRHLETITHTVGTKVCAHTIWAVDGGLRVCRPDELNPNIDSMIPVQQSLTFGTNPDGERSLIGVYEIPCELGSAFYEIDHASQRIGSGKQLYALADWLRPVHIQLEARHLRGYRQDVESTFRTAKAALALLGRASSLRPDHFLLDAVGCALWINATAWDVHTSQHTLNGQRCAEHLARKANQAGRRTSDAAHR